MSAIMVAQITVRDPEKLKEYSRIAPDTIAPYNGKFLFFGKKAEIICGTHDHEFIGVLEFPDKESIKAWYNSPEYQAVIPIRDEASEMVFVTYDPVPMERWKEQNV